MRPAPRPASLPAHADSPETTATATPDRLDEIRAAIRRGAEYLTGSVQEDGSFVYRINLDPSVKVKPAYNMLRHAGAMYALASYHERWPSAQVARALAQTSKYLHRFMRPLEERDDAIAVWESEAQQEAKLGGAGLALVALVSQEHAVPGTANAAELSRVGTFVTFMQKSDGGFHSKYFSDARGRSDAWTSLYYPGEAALGLVMLHELVPGSGWLDAAVRSLGFLANMRRGRARVEPDHWALIATGRLFSEHGTADWPHDKGLLRTHALQICESVLMVDQDLVAESPLYGAFDPDGRTTPTATRLEGLLAALPLLQGTADVELGTRMRTAIDAGVQFLLNAQVREGVYAGAVPRGVHLRADEPTRSSFNRRVTEVRIDYVQHAMSAWMGYLDLASDDVARAGLASPEGAP